MSKERANGPSGEGKADDSNSKINKKQDEIEDKIETELYGDALSHKGGYSDIEDAQSMKPSIAKRKMKKRDSSDEDDSDLFSDHCRK